MIDHLDSDFDIIGGFSSHPVYNVVDPSPFGEDKIKDLEAFQQLPKCLVVMRVTVIHSEVAFATKTGLFGLLGDARVQIIDASEEALVESYMHFAEKCERANAVLVPQDFGREPVAWMEQKLRKVVWREFGSEGLLEIMRPAIMFRLCVRRCNHVVEREGERGQL